MHCFFKLKQIMISVLAFVDTVNFHECSTLKGHKSKSLATRGSSV